MWLRMLGKSCKNILPNDGLPGYKLKNHQKNKSKTPIDPEKNTQKDTKSPKRKAQSSTNCKLCPTNKRNWVFSLGFFQAKRLKPKVFRKNTWCCHVFFGNTNAFFTAVFRDTLVELTKLPLTIGLFCLKNENSSNPPTLRIFRNQIFALSFQKQTRVPPGFQHHEKKHNSRMKPVHLTLPETNMAPEHVWLEYYFRSIFRGYVSFREWNVPQNCLAILARKNPRRLREGRAALSFMSGSIQLLPRFKVALHRENVARRHLRRGLSGAVTKNFLLSKW